MKKTFFSIIVFISFIELQAQESIGINNDNPHPSAVLDIASTDKGVLVPRMSSAQRTAITSPARGLLLFDTTTNTFWFYNSLTWVEIKSTASLNEISDADGDTRIQVEESLNENIIRYDMGGTEYFRMYDGRLGVSNTGNSVFIGENAGASDDLSDNNNVFIGSGSGQQNISGSDNVGLGYLSLTNNLSGVHNIAVGSSALENNTSGNSNIAIGFNALRQSTVSANNIAIGSNVLSFASSGTTNMGVGASSLSSMLSGSNNVAIGFESLRDNPTGSNNTAIGHYAGSQNMGSGNVFIGYSAGSFETGSNKLYIEPSSSSSPLIWGDFSTDSLVVNGNFHSTRNITYVGTITDVSDYRLKENFDTLTNVLSLVEKLQAYTYNLKSAVEKEREYGLIAQEVQKVFPEMVQLIDAEKGYLGVSYIQLIPVLIQAIKEQQDIIVGQEKRVAASVNLLNELKESFEYNKQLKDEK